MKAANSIILLIENSNDWVETEKCEFFTPGAFVYV